MTDVKHQTSPEMFFKISCTEKIGKALIACLAAMQAVAGDNFDDSSLQVEMDVKQPREGRVLGARVQYRALLPTGSVASIQNTINENLAGLGSHTIKGIIYQSIADATMADEVITERMLTETKHFRTKTVQRSIVELRQAGLIASQPLIPPQP